MVSCAMKDMRPKIITMCGSLKFQDEHMRQAQMLELEGNLVISCVYPPPESKKENYTKEQLDVLAKLHYAKIDLSDAIFVVNVGGYIGKSTRSEIEYAEACEKEIIWLEGINEHKRTQ